MTIHEQITNREYVHRVSDCIESKLKPYVKKVDTEAYYAREYLLMLGKEGLISSQRPLQEMLCDEVKLIEATSEQCMTTGFSLWCHVASMTYLRQSQNAYLRGKVLPLLENGQLLGATGLSNPMKFYAGLESLHLQAIPTIGGYVIKGTLPMVSNLHEGHWFGFVAQVEGENRRIFGAIQCSHADMMMHEKLGYLALNGSATYSCKFDHVFLPADWVISEDADSFIPQIRPMFVLYQIPLGLGVIRSAIDSIHQCIHKQNGCNQFLPTQVEELEAEYQFLRQETYALCDTNHPSNDVKKYFKIRLAVVYLALKATQAEMLHQGGSAYFQYSASSRRLRESYFLANLTPTVKHLEKLLHI